MLTAVAMAALVLAVAALALLTVVLAYVRRLRDSADATRQAVQRLAERPVAPHPRPAAPTPAPVVPVSQVPPPEARHEVPVPPPPQSVLSAALGLLVLKGAAFTYGLSRALGEERRGQAADVMNAHLRARRRARRSGERRSKSGQLP